MSPQLGVEYELLAAIARFSQFLGWIAIFVGALLREGLMRKNVGVVAEGAGWVALVGAGIVGSQVAAAQALNCTLWGGDCIESDAQAWDYLWDHLLSGIVIDLVIGLTAELLGWTVAKLRSRRRALKQ